MSGYGSGHSGDIALKALHDKPLFEPAYDFRRSLKLLEICRQELGEEVELLHDMHERLTPNLAVQFCKEAEKFHMFFLEDPLSPEDLAYFQQIRQNCATPIAMGELFNSLHPGASLPGRRFHSFAQDRHPGRTIWRENRMARSGRRFPGRTHGQRHPGYCQL
jgi:mannonate dehydratase